MPEPKEQKTQSLYRPNDKALVTIKWVYQNFDTMWLNNQRTYEQFNGKTLKTYVEEGRKSINIMNQPREDGRSNVKSITPLNKLLAILARTAQKRPDIAVLAQNKKDLIDKARSDIIKDLYNWSYQNMQEEVDADIQYFFKAFDTTTDGTYITYEGFDNQTHTQKRITKFDPNTGEVEWKEEKFKTNQCFSQQVKITDFYIWNPYLRSIQKQPRVCWRTVYDKENFNAEFKDYLNHKFVQSGVFYRNDQADGLFQNQWQNRVRDDQIEVLRMFEAPKGDSGDRMVIMANGVVLQDTPMIWENGKPKKYPFAHTINSLFAGGEFFWGMHLWHKLEGDVSALETLFNIGIEQAKLSVNPPMLNATENEIEDNNLIAGRVLDVDDIDKIRELQFKSPDQSFFTFLDLIGQNINLSTIDPVAGGQNIQNVTARGQVIAEENARKLLSNFNLMMENLVLQEAKLRIPNIIQFQFLPGSQFRTENTNIKGEVGVREVQVLPINGKKMAQMSKEERELMENELGMIEKMAEIHGINLERLIVSADFLQDIKYNLGVVKESSFAQSKALDIAQYLERIGVTAQFFPEIFNGAKEIFFKDFMQKYNEDPNKYLEAAQGAGGTEQLMSRIQQLQGGRQQGGRQGGGQPTASPISPTTGRLGGAER